MPITTVQETSKRLKSHILMSAGLIVFGLFWMVSVSSAAASSNQVPNTGFPTLLMVGGLVWFIVTRFRIWWEHK